MTGWRLTNILYLLLKLHVHMFSGFSFIFILNFGVLRRTQHSPAQNSHIHEHGLIKKH